MTNQANQSEGRKLWLESETEKTLSFESSSPERKNLNPDQTKSPDFDLVPPLQPAVSIMSTLVWQTKLPRQVQLTL